MRRLRNHPRLHEKPVSQFTYVLNSVFSDADSDSASSQSILSYFDDLCKPLDRLTIALLCRSDGLSN